MNGRHTNTSIEEFISASPSPEVFTRIKTLAFVVVVAAISLVLPHVAFAEPLTSSKLDVGMDSGLLEAHADELSSEYALLKSDGWLYRANDKGNALENGTLWYGPSSMAQVKTLFEKRRHASGRVSGLQRI